MRKKRRKKLIYVCTTSSLKIKNTEHQTKDEKKKKEERKRQKERENDEIFHSFSFFHFPQIPSFSSQLSLILPNLPHSFTFQIHRSDE